MKFPFLFLPFLLAFFPAGCTSDQLHHAFAARTLQLSYDDLGPASLVKPVLGERGSDPVIVVHSGATNPTASPRRLNAHQAILLMRSNARRLPKTPENEALLQRMNHAYSRLYAYYQWRRNAFLSVPPFFGRGAVARMSVAPPPVPPTL
ncbi:MAG: hypothetical protein U1F71_04135 [Verrucomicrobiaceae bacterium]